MVSPTTLGRSSNCIAFERSRRSAAGRVSAEGAARRRLLSRCGAMGRAAMRCSKPGAGLCPAPHGLPVEPAGRLLWCEPNAATAAALAISDLPHAMAGRVAVSPRDGEGIWRAADRGLLAPVVRIRSLDPLVAEHRLRRLDLLKIGVDGDEVEVPAGAADGASVSSASTSVR